MRNHPNFYSLQNDCGEPEFFTKRLPSFDFTKDNAIVGIFVSRYQSVS